MQQIVLNLLMNACEAMSGLPVADRNVKLATRFLPEESCVQVTMTDSGGGIPPGELERIFQPFVTTKPNGMGMGLAICRTVAESHRGRLWAESRPGRRDVSFAGARGRGARMTGSNREPIVFLVDDDASIRTAMRRGLVGGGLRRSHLRRAPTPSSPPTIPTCRAASSPTSPCPA